MSNAATGDGSGGWLPAVVERVAYGNNGYHSSPGYGRPVTLTDARGHQTTLAYTTWGGTTRFPLRTVTTTNPLGHASVTEFDIYGNQIRSTDVNGRHSYVCYDAVGRVTKVYQPGIAGGSTCTGDPSQTFAYTYTLQPKIDPTIGSVSHARWAIQTRTLFSLAADSWKPNSTSAPHYLEAWSLFDGYGRLAQTNQPSPVAVGPGFDRLVTRTVYDSRDNPVRQSQPILHAGVTTGAVPWDNAHWAVERDVSSSFDPLGRPTTRCDRDNDVVLRCAYTHYLSPDRVEAYPPFAAGGPVIGGTVTWFNADGNPRAVAELNNTGGHSFTGYRYNRAGWLTKIIDPAGNQTTFTYNALGWRTSLVDPNAGSSGAVYWPTGEVRHSRDANQQIIFNTIDQLGRTTYTADNYTTPTSGTGVLAQYWWDGPHSTGTLAGAKGMSTRVENRNGATVLARTELTALDDMGRPTTTRYTVPAADHPGITGDEALAAPYSITTAYTRNGVPRQTVYPGVAGSNLPSAETVTTLFNLHGLPVQVAGAAIYTSDIEYDSYGRVAKTWMGPAGSTAGLQTQHVYQDSDGRLSRIVANTRAGTLITDATYSYDHQGNPVRIQHNSGTSSETECFTYDGRQRLTAAYTQTGVTTCPASVPGAATGPAPYRLLYSFDAIHRATSFEGRTMTYGASGHTGCRTGTPATKPHAVTTATASTVGDPAQTLTYNCNGAVVTQAIAGQTTTYTWDKQQRLASTTTPAGTTTNVYDHTNNRVLRVDPDGTRTVYLGPTEIRHQPGVGVRVARSYGNTRRDFTGETTHYVTDHHGTVAAYTNSSGPRVLRTLPYGTPRVIPGGAINLDDRNFLNQPDDPHTRTVYLNNRHYLPGLGQFLSVDPLAITTRQPYLYANGNPISLSDESGLAPVPGACPDGPTSNCVSSGRGHRDRPGTARSGSFVPASVLSSAARATMNYDEVALRLSASLSVCTYEMWRCRESLSAGVREEWDWDVNGIEGMRLAVNHIQAQLDAGVAVQDPRTRIIYAADDLSAVLRLNDVIFGNDGKVHILTQWVPQYPDISIGIDWGCWGFVCLQTGVSDDGKAFVYVGAAVAISTPGVFATTANRQGGNYSSFFITATTPYALSSSLHWNWDQGQTLQDGYAGAGAGLSWPPGVGGGFVHWFTWVF